MMKDLARVIGAVSTLILKEHVLVIVVVPQGGVWGQVAVTTCVGTKIALVVATIVAVSMSSSVSWRKHRHT